MSDPAADADLHAAYFARLLALAIAPGDALAMTVAYIQATALQVRVDMPPERPDDTDGWKT